MFGLERFKKFNNIEDSNPTVIGAVISNSSGLPEHLSVVNSSSIPSLWFGVDTKDQYVVLIDDKRSAYIVTTQDSYKQKKSLTALARNLQNQAYVKNQTITVTNDLMQKLIGSTYAKNNTERLLSMKSEPLVRFKGWLEAALKMQATDLHLETSDLQGKVRVRAHGEMWPLADAVSGRYRAEQITETISSIFQNLTLGSSNSSSLWKSNTDSYTMLNYDLAGKSIKMRFQSSAGHLGPKAVIRILNGSDAPSKSLDELGYAESHLREFRTAQQTTNGLVCLAGITGSGKTTTIRSFIETHPDNGQIVINTIEDPVELDIKGAHQTSVQRDFNDSREEARKKFNGAINAMLRSDIDIGMLGELRDDITANAWLNVAETGHMGIATLHAHRLTGILPRLTNKTMGLSMDVLTTPQTINLFAYQALIPGNCPHCKLSTDEILSKADIDKSKVVTALNAIQSLDVDPTYFRWRNPQGCSTCNWRGTEGQELLAELLTPDYRWLDLMRAGRVMEANDYHRQRGNFDLKSNEMYCKSIVEHGLFKVSEGKIDLTTLSRFEKLSDFTENFKRLRKG